MRTNHTSIAPSERNIIMANLNLYPQQTSYSKEELSLSELNYSSLNEFYDAFIKDFLNGQEKREISKPKYQKKGDINFVECDASYYSGRHCAGASPEAISNKEM